MKLDRSLRSKVARRVFVLFVLCALVPIVGLATVSYLQVRKQLTEQSQRWLYQTAKGKALAIFERLSFLETELSLLASELADGELDYRTFQEASGARNGKTRFRALAVVDRGQVTSFIGESIPSPRLHRREWDHLAEGRSIVGTFDDSDHDYLVWMAYALSAPGHPDEHPVFLLATVDEDYLWAVEDLPSMSQLTVLDASGKLLFSTLAPKDAGQIRRRSRQRHFRWSRESETFVSSSFQLPLRFAFASPSWTVVLSEPEANLLTSVTEFMRAYPLVVLLSFWVVLFVSIGQIRQSLGPLERLKEGTRRIAERDFSTVVKVRSGDEFEELAESFNGMTRRLGQQFHTLSTMSEIDRAVLSTLDTEEIVRRLHRRLYDILAAERIQILLLFENPYSTAYTTMRDEPADVRRVAVTPDPEVVGELLRHPDGLHVGSIEASRLDGLSDGSSPANLLFPVVLDDKPAAVVSLGYASSTATSEEEQERARQLVDRFAVALKNARLLEDLDRLNWGSLVALARTIDAKSPWTAGHSERAARLAVSIGRSMGLDESELDIIHRGGLLHDIGKIGIPPAILDKKGALTEEERAVMKEHPVLGARILEPIGAYQKFIPVVLQHHEWYDGSGYPDGVAGEAISLHARIYAVADVYDALFADRPYRSGLARDEVVAYIRSRSGTQFDPRVVESFLRLVERSAPELEDRSRHVHRLTEVLNDGPATAKRS